MEAAVLEVRALGAWEVALAGRPCTWRESEAYFRRWRDGRLKVTLPRVRWMEESGDA
jgi:hypothetical protein